MKTRLFRPRRMWRTLVICAFTVPLTACITAAIPLTMMVSAAVVGFSGYKVYQTVSGSKVGTEFKDEQISPEASAVLTPQNSSRFGPLQVELLLRQLNGLSNPCLLKRYYRQHKAHKS